MSTTMVEKTKKNKKALISEEDISTLLQRYTATTVLALLQEVAQFPGVKLDWNALVKKSSTGISNAREYQMLWRHLAYRDALLEKLEDEAEPLDDDSDLEYELEAFPDVSSEASTEAAACVKVLTASGLPSDSSLPNSSTVEAPLIINIPNGQSFRTPENSQLACSIRGMNITVPVSVQKQPLPTVSSTEGLDTNGLASGMPARRKRKPWSESEDLELIAAVQKCGEGNWANILRGDFKGDRTASQLSQRWAIIRKRHGNLNLGANSTGSQLSEAQLAARNAMALALNMPVKKNLTPVGTNSSAGVAFMNTSCSPVTTGAETSLVGSSFAHAQQQAQQGHILSRSSPMGQFGSTAKSRVTSKKTLAKSNFSSDSMVRAAAVAAGARIATPSDAASLLKAAQAKNAVHIMPTGGSSIKSSMPSGAATHLEAHPNVHYICTGPPPAPLSTYPAVTSSTTRTGSVKAASPTAQHTPSTSASSSNLSAEQTNAVTSGLASELIPKQEPKNAGEIKVYEPVNAPKEQVQEDRGCVSGNESSEEVRVNKIALTNPEAGFKNQPAVSEMPITSWNMEIVESGQADITCNQADESQIANDKKMMDSSAKGGNQSAVEENCDNQSANMIQADLPIMATDGCSEHLEVLSKAEAGNNEM